MVCPSKPSFRTLRAIPSAIALAAGALVLVASVPAVAVVCGIAPEVSGVIERTIAGDRPMGGDFDVVVLGVVEDIGPDTDGYREVAMDVGVVLRGSAPRQYTFAYPASADEPRPMFIRGATYLVAVESQGMSGGPTTHQCSATKRVIHPDEIAQYISMAEDPVIYRDAFPVAVDEDSSSVDPSSVGPMIGTLVLTSLLAVTLFAWLSRRSSQDQKR